MSPRALARRLATAALTLVLVTILVFALIRLSPGEPFGESDEDTHPLSAQARAELRSLYRLDEPLHRQYLGWLSDVLRGELGRSFHDRQPVAQKIGDRLGITIALNLASLALMLAVAIPLGAATALRPGSIWDRIAGTGTYLLYSVPVFWAGLLMQMFFAVRLGWLPLAGLRSPAADLFGPAGRLLDQIAHMALPVLCLSYGGLAYLSRFVRANLIASAAPESWRAARARGLSARAVLYRHGLRQAGMPMLTLAGFLLPALVSGSVIVERIFAIPGLGMLFVEAAGQRDVPVLMGLTLLSGTATVAGILGADLAYAAADPRIRRG